MSPDDRIAIEMSPIDQALFRKIVLMKRLKSMFYRIFICILNYTCNNAILCGTF